MTQYIKSYNIANNSIKSFAFDSSVANTFNAASVASAVAISANVAAQAVSTFVTLQTQQVAALPPSISNISITDSSYNVIDDTAANTSGGYIEITGSNFQSGAIVMVGSSNTALTTTLVNSSTLRAQIPAIAAGTYPVYVVNSNGGTGIRINGLTTSPFPAWSTGTTLTGQNSAVAFAISIAATSDSNVAYSNTTVLPTGTTLLSNGYFYGTSSPVSTTTYSFDVKATDTENQDATRTFSLTVSIPPEYRLWAWGTNTNGELGTTNRITVSSPIQVGSDTNWQLISAGGYHNHAIKSNGTLWAWGKNLSGELGLNNRVNRSSPIQVGALTNWSWVSAAAQGSSASSAAIKTDGTLWTWGVNGSVLGQNDNIARSSPTQVGSDTNWKNIHVTSIAKAIKTNGTLWAWGNNSYGNLGLNNTIERSSPVQIGTDTNWSKAISGSATTLAIKTNGTLWAWGFGDNGRLGLNDRVSRSSPVQIGTDTNWSSITLNEWGSAAAIKTDGTLWAWGQNSFAELGLNDRVQRSSPTQVGILTNWTNIVASRDSVGVMMAIKTDGTLWGWGSQSNSGLLATNDQITRSSPVQIGTNTNWYQVDIGKFHTIARTIN